MNLSASFFVYAAQILRRQQTTIPLINLENPLPCVALDKFSLGFALIFCSPAS